MTWSALDLAPGALVVVFALVADRILTRFYDSVPPRVWIAFAVVLFVLFAPVLFGGFTLMPLDILPEFVPWQPYADVEASGNRIQIDMIEELVPWQAQVRRSLKALELPLWNPSSGAGAPLLANPQTSPFHPLSLLVLALPLTGAVSALAALRVLVALLGMYLLLRQHTIDELPALMGALAYGLSGYLLLFLGWPHANAASFLPVLLYANVLWFTRGGRASVLLLVGSMISIGLAGHPESVLYALLAFAVHSLLLLSESRHRSRAKLVGWLGAGALAVLLALPALLPALSYLPQTTRFAGIEERNRALKKLTVDSWQIETTLATMDERLLPVVAPNAYGNNRWREFWGSLNSNESAGGFAGSAALLAALVVMLGFASTDRRARWLQAVTVILLIVIARPPGLPLLMVRLPLLDSSPTFHRRMLMLVAFAVAALAVLAWQRWTQEAPARGRLLIASAGLISLIAWAYLGHPKPGDPDALSGVRHATLALQVGTVVAATALLWKVATRGRQLGMVGLIAFELLAIHRPSHPPVTKELFFPVTPSIEFLQTRLWSEEERGYRMMGLHAAMPPESATIFDLRDARSSGPSQSQAFRELTRPLRNPQFPLLFDKPDHPLLNLLAVRYVIASPRHRARRPLREVYRDEHAVVFERPRALPILFLPNSAALDDPRWSGVGRQRNFRRRSFVQSDGVGDVTEERPWRAQLEPPSFTIDAVGRSRLSATIESNERRLLASSVFQDGGWSVHVNGTKVPTLKVNGPFVGAWIPAGAAQIELVYWPERLTLAFIVSALALGVLTTLVVRNRHLGPWQDSEAEEI